MIKNKMISLTILLACLSSVFGYAQTPEEIESKMNEIKLDESYVYGEDLNNDKDIAFQNALTELTTYANELRAGKGKDILNSSDLLTVVKELKYQKGSRHTVLVYLPLSQMLGMASKSHSDIVAQNAPSHSSQANITPQQKVEQEQKFTFVPNKQPEATQPVQIQTQLPDDIMQTLCSQDNWLEIKGILTNYKREGKISSIGNVLSYAEVPDDAYAILMDNMGGILSILSPKNSATRINFRTNQTDSETNHSNYKFIVWYK
ncbi:MAG: hypothetical protein HDS45_02040 [Bacteroides sp.]|nr:hypothetical protein [Bacteroides sp.]